MTRGERAWTHPPPPPSAVAFRLTLAHVWPVDFCGLTSRVPYCGPPQSSSRPSGLHAVTLPHLGLHGPGFSRTPQTQPHRMWPSRPGCSRSGTRRWQVRQAQAWVLEAAGRSGPARPLLRVSPGRGPAGCGIPGASAAFSQDPGQGSGLSRAPRVTVRAAPAPGPRPPFPSACFLLSTFHPLRTRGATVLHGASFAIIFFPSAACVRILPTALPARASVPAALGRPAGLLPPRGMSGK